jgi:hypothetical protein
MHTHIIAAGLNNPASNWLSQFKAGWNSTPAAPAAHAAAAPGDTGLIMVVLVVIIIAVIYGGLKKMAG